MLIFAIVSLQPRPATAQIKMRIIGQETQAPIAISAFKNNSGDDNHEISDAFTRTLTRDVQLSGYFRLVDPHAYIEDAQQSGYELGQFNFADWRSINADFLVKGAITSNGSEVKITAYLYDVAQQRRMMGKNFTGSADDVPRMARRFADSLLEATTGQKGPFDTKLAFVSTGKGRFKEVYTQSIDGQDVFKLTDNPTINLFPSWDESTRFLLYLSYKTGELTVPRRSQATGRIANHQQSWGDDWRWVVSRWPADSGGGRTGGCYQSLFDGSQRQ